MRFPFADRATLGCHAEFSPSAATALATAACFVECLRVPFGTRAARCFAAGECFGWSGSEACASESVRGVAEASKYLSTEFDNMRRNRHEKIKVGAGTFCPTPEFVVCAINDLPFIVYVTS